MPDGTLVDSNVILDVATSDPKWAPWSEAALADAARTGPLVINAVVFAEVSVGYEQIEHADLVMSGDVFLRAPIPFEAAFLAGKAFLAYRRRGGRRGQPLPDFFVGAHAAVAGLQLLTRDARRYRTYYPGLQLIAP
jgi:predicted nucleic acid-binding protein